MSDLNHNNPEQDTPIPGGFVPATPPVEPPATPTPPVDAPVVPPETPPGVPPAAAALPPLPEKTGDPALDLALSYVMSKGVKLDDPAVEAARNGDFTAIEAKLKATGATDYEAYLAAAKDAYTRFDAKSKAKAQELLSTAETICKDAGGWEAVKTWASANASPEQAKEINEALANGGLQAKATLAWLARAYTAANPERGKPAVNPGAPAGGSAAADGLSASEYAREVDKLYASRGFRDVTGTPEYKALQARRLAGKAAGR